MTMTTFEFAWRPGRACPSVRRRCCYCHARRYWPDIELSNVLGRWAWRCTDVVGCVQGTLSRYRPVPGRPHLRRPAVRLPKPRSRTPRYEDKRPLVVASGEVYSRVVVNLDSPAL